MRRSSVSPLAGVKDRDEAAVRRRVAWLAVGLHHWYDESRTSNVTLHDRRAAPDRDPPLSRKAGPRLSEANEPPEEGRTSRSALRIRTGRSEDAGALHELHRAAS